MEQWRRWGPRQDGFRVCASARATRTGPGGGGGWSALRLTVCRPGGFASRRVSRSVFRGRRLCRGVAGWRRRLYQRREWVCSVPMPKAERKQRRPRECVLGGAETREAESPLRGMHPRKGPLVASFPARRGRRCALGAGQHLHGPAWRFQASARRSKRRAGGGRERRPPPRPCRRSTRPIPLGDRAAWRRRRRLRGADDVSDRGTEPAGGRRETGTPCWTCVTANQGSTDVSVLLLASGNGTLRAKRPPVGRAPYYDALGDIINDDDDSVRDLGDVDGCRPCRRGGGRRRRCG